MLLAYIKMIMLICLNAFQDCQVEVCLTPHIDLSLIYSYNLIILIFQTRRKQKQRYFATLFVTLELNFRCFIE